VAALRVAISAASRWLLDQAGGREWRLARVARVRYLAAFPFLRLYKKLSRTDVAANRLPPLGLAILAPPVAYPLATNGLVPSETVDFCRHWDYWL
jgi:hypothetical protein